MTSIFLSHSSKDNQAANRLKAWLEAEERGHWVFLDTDLQTGILTGQKWEEVLYDNLRLCRVFLPLYSINWAESKWCFAEMTHARAIGKLILPVKLERDFDSTGLFSDIQQTPIDLDGPEDAGLARLDRALREEFPWDDPNRPPYPGLWAFQEGDAAIYKGRDPEVTELLEELEGLRRGSGGTERFLLLLGASGSGKSSLVRAGVIPRLRCDPGWLVLPPLIPRTAPLDEFAELLARAFRDAGASRDFVDLKGRLEAGVAAKQNGGETLLDLLRELRVEAAASDQTSVLVIIDQAEELFSEQVETEAQGLLRLLRAAMESAQRRLLVLATMRSEFLESFQRQPFLHDSAFGIPLAYKSIPLDPLPGERFPAIIRAPEQLTGLRIDADLVERMCRDTATQDALPLLAYTLRRMWDNEAIRADCRFELAEYLEIGGLEGSIVKAADAVLAGVRDDPKQLQAIHAAFVPTLVRITAEGAPVRRRAKLMELRDRAKEAINAFVDNRLLMTDRDRDGNETIEVAHEALLRVWPQLATWLEEDRDSLRQLGALQRAASDWAEAIESGHGKELLLHRGERLHALETLVTEPRFSLGPESIEERYLHACRDAEDRRQAQRQAEQEQRIRDAEKVAAQQKQIAEVQRRSASRLKTGVGIIFVFFIVASVIAAFAFQQKKKADESAEVAGKKTKEALLQLARNHWNSAVNDRVSKPLKAANLFALAAKAFSHAGKADLASNADLVREKILGPLQLQTAVGHDGALLGARFSPDGMRILTWSDDDSAGLWDAATGEAPISPLKHNGDVLGAVFTKDGSRILTWSKDGTARLWDSANGAELIKPLVHGDWVSGALFSADEQRILTWSRDDTARVWDSSSGRPLTDPLSHKRFVDDARFSPDENMVLTRTWNGARVWDSGNGAALTPMLGQEGRVIGARFSPDGTRVVTWDRRGGRKSVRRSARVWDSRTGEPVTPELLHEGDLQGAQFSSDGAWLLTWSKDRTARLWDCETGHLLVPPWEHNGAVNGAHFSADDSRVLTWSADGSIHLWGWQSGEPAAAPMMLEGEIKGALFSEDESQILSWSDGGAARLWNSESGEPMTPPMYHQGSVLGAAFSSDGSRILTWSDDGSARLWDSESGKSIMPPMRQQGMVTASFSCDGRRILTWSRDGGARVWSSGAGDPSAPRHRFGTYVLGADFINGSARVLSWGAKGIQVWDDETGKELGLPIKGGAPAVSRVHFDANKTLVLGWGGGEARIWDTRSGEAKGEPLEHFVDVESAQLSPDGARVLGWNSCSGVRVWDSRTGRLLTAGIDHRRWIHGAYFSADGTRIVTKSEEGPNVDVSSCTSSTGIVRTVAQLWNSSTGKALTPPFPHEGATPRLDIAKSRFLTYSEDGGVWVLDVVTGEPLMPPLQLGPGLLWASLDSNERRILIQGADGTVRLWDASNGKPLAHQPMTHSSKVEGTSYSADGKRLLTWTIDGSARVWDLASGAPLTPPMEHGGGSGWDKMNAAFSPDEVLVLTWRDNHFFGAQGRRPYRGVRIWDSTTGEEAAPAIRHNHRLRGVLVSRSGARILTWSEGTTVRLWDTRSGDYLMPPMEHDRMVLGAELSDDETRILSWCEDGNIRLWDIAQDSRLPYDKLPLKTEVESGTFLRATGELGILPPAVWQQKRASIQRDLRQTDKEQ